MAEYSSFFDAHYENGAYDRVYLAAHFAKYFASFIGNGIYGGKSSELLVQQNDTANMSVKVLSGEAFINGYRYENDSNLSLSIDTADGVLNRIDIIVIRWSNSDRAIRAVVEKGTPSANPVAPTLKRNADYYDLKLAQVYIGAGATRITQENITDFRLDTSVCGLVQGVIQQFDTTAFGQQINSFIENFKTSNNAKANKIFSDLNALIHSDIATGLVADVDMLKQIAIESNDYKGCYYRIFEGAVEWINPPSQYGAEYRTTERWQNKPIYQKTFYVAALPISSVLAIESNTQWDKVISVSGYAHDADDLTYYPFPIIIGKQVTPMAIINRVESDGSIVITTNDDASYLRAYITIRYTKT